ncbi:MarR family winged helix-turn-helix transcriptional regulator [Demequina sp. SYSU T00039]|uniref:MarR family winged helix-turn-helix transcriptional regulator n=1 Tax=Demequina lignilytica TaxID=3051663 RepID=A0AAW7M8L9_9MICO|nr:MULTISPECIES: MarR family winged helix-turn-helix transcriptional regulator [unclassified Demequina]MDN4477323.1 MarR family winged helix-turn-helix transcriptional regulator [Demequina sp. SYSU T00039-1]MDN4487496.1 MarR family winged helix-turn-helix transcriptional regulator [Demequina sp. SYSU T00039]
MTSRTDHLADVATAAISVARKIQSVPFDDPGIVPLCHLDRIVIRHIDRFPGLQPSEVAADLGLQASNASTAIRSLTRLGLVEKRTDGADRRAKHLHLTAAGEDVGRRVRGEWAALLDPLVSSDEDAATLARALVALDDALNRHVGSHGALGPERTEPGAQASTSVTPS